MTLVDWTIPFTEQITFDTGVRVRGPVDVLARLIAARRPDTR